MDDLQEVYDMIFENPTTVRGLRNKIYYLEYLMKNLQYSNNVLTLAQVIHYEESTRLRNVISMMN